ncbi:MAG: tRNA lysidine(34) synthetase TilS [Ignavibacteria bacterium RBG_13_36_8]|nr:MAG: tRNA lysidine(34) synthetase TilS [Ignavibacteria bacterium RBG_13_36_8]
MKRIEQKVIKYIDRHNLILAGDRILVGFSGGPDSVFLIHFLDKYRGKYNIRIAALHVNHGLRGKDADKDELFCKRLCEKLNVDFYSVKVDVKKYAKKHKQSIEEAARILRYKSFNKICAENNFNKIATAHNCGDNTETVLINLFHGTGLSGISGIPAKRENIIRPLLILSKAEILSYLKDKSIGFRTDKSNLNEDIERNFLRQRIIPLVKGKLNPSLEETILKSSETYRSTAVLLSKYIEEISQRYVEFSKGELSIDLKVLEVYPEDVLGEFFKNILQKYFSYPFSFNDFHKLSGLIKKQTGREINLVGGLTACKERGNILIKKIKKVEFVQRKLGFGDRVDLGGNIFGIDKYTGNDYHLNSVKKEEIISADHLDDTFVLRTWKAGDKFVPLGMKSFKKISDFLNEQKVPSSMKKSQLVLVNRNNIVWVVGLRIDDRVKISEETNIKCKLWMK